MGEGEGPVEVLTIENEPLEVARAADWLDVQLNAIDCPSKARASLHVALEEALTNILLYAYRDLETHRIEVRFTHDGDGYVIETLDDGIDFDPTQVAPPAHDDTAGLQAGGLGLTFMRRMMDDVTFARHDGRNHLIMRKARPI